ncbi:MAG: adenine deaminase, partial [Candidatus Dadabacteria bacterium]
MRGDPRILSELAVGFDRIDGHAPGLTGRALNAYLALGPSTDHEATGPEEAREKLARGMRILIREGSAARNLEALLPLVTPATERRFCLCTDDLSPADLRDRGGVDFALRRAVELGLDPFVAWRLATLNPAEAYGLSDRGAVAPGRRADLVLWEDLSAPRPVAVYRAGRRVDTASPGEPLPGPPQALRDTVRIAWDRVGFDLPTAGRARVIRVVPGQIVTRAEEVDLGAKGPDPSRDLARLAVIERHHGSGRVGLGFVARFGLRRGALASTVAHDHHNLIVLGRDDASMLTAARAVAEAGGGMAAAAGERVLALLPLPVAGLLSLAPLEEVARAQHELDRAARELGVTLPEPFWTL